MYKSNYENSISATKLKRRAQLKPLKNMENDRVHYKVEQN